MKEDKGGKEIEESRRSGMCGKATKGIAREETSTFY